MVANKYNIIESTLDQLAQQVRGPVGYQCPGNSKARCSTNIPFLFLV